MPLSSQNITKFKEIYFLKFCAYVALVSLSLLLFVIVYYFLTHRMPGVKALAKINQTT